MTESASSSSSTAILHSTDVLDDHGLNMAENGVKVEDMNGTVSANGHEVAHQSQLGPVSASPATRSASSRPGDVSAGTAWMREGQNSVLTSVSSLFQASAGSHDEGEARIIAGVIWGVFVDPKCPAGWAAPGCVCEGRLPGLARPGPVPPGVPLSLFGSAAKSQTGGILRKFPTLSPSLSPLPGCSTQ